MTTFQSELECREQALEEVNSAVVVVHNMAIKHASRRAIRWLSSFFHDGPASNDQLPDLLLRWFVLANLARRQTIGCPAVLPIDRGIRPARLNIRMLETSRPDEVLLLLSREVGHDCPESLQRLGLARREAEVLFWISKGKTSRETAAILSITRKTVDKHVERIHRKLGVETRIAAAAIAWSAMRDS